jgi:hypothetical protein
VAGGFTDESDSRVSYGGVGGRLMRLNAVAFLAITGWLIIAAAK